jgi:hypothetical protein
MKRFVHKNRKALLSVFVHVFLLFFFAGQASASESLASSIRVTQSTGLFTFLFTNGLIAAGFGVLSWYLLKKSN